MSVGIPIFLYALGQTIKRPCTDSDFMFSFDIQCQLMSLLFLLTLLFLLDINDLPASVGSKFRLFADDCVLSGFMLGCAICAKNTEMVQRNYGHVAIGHRLISE